MNYIGAFLMFTLLLVQCREKSPPAISIDPRLRPMLDSFLLEASARDIELKAELENIVIQFGRMEGRKGGSCKPNHSPKIVTIDSLKWKHIDEAERESLVFHELAHCLLSRHHNNKTLKFGECSSLMREGVSNCHLNWSNKIWRSYYLDELFAPDETDDPEWHSSIPEFYIPNDSIALKRIHLRGKRFQPFEIPQAVFYNWIINFTAQRPASGFAYVGLRVNEIVMEASFIGTGASPDRARPVIRLNILVVGAERALVETISEGETMHLSLRKHGNAIYIFIDQTLQYAFPITPAGFKIGAYSSLPESHYNISLYGINAGT